MARASKTPFISSSLNITLVLFFLGVFGLVVLTFDRVITTSKEELEMKIFLSEQATDETARALLQQIAKKPYVQQARYVSPDEALASFDEAGENFLAAMDGINPFPASINVKLRENYINTDSVYAVSQLLLHFDLVQEVDYPIVLIERADANKSLVMQISLLLMVLLTIITMLLIVNTVKLAIFSRRLAIRSMQLIGATNAFIKRPFLQIGLAQGLIGGALALGLIHGLLYAISVNFIDLSSVLNSMALKFLYAGLVVFGAVLGWLSSNVAVSRYLNKNLDQLA
jgi:cell division transport system permease protein